MWGSGLSNMGLVFCSAFVKCSTGLRSHRNWPGVALSGELSFYASMETGSLEDRRKVKRWALLLRCIPASGSFADAHWNMTHK